jgi:phosphatidylglycerophosphate synthase
MRRHADSAGRRHDDRGQRRPIGKQSAGKRRQLECLMIEERRHEYLGEVSETSQRLRGEQDRPALTVADVLSAVRIPLAIVFPLVSDTWRVVVLAAAAASDLLDGQLARRFGSSRFGSVIDPVADKLFMASAFGVVAFSGKLEWYEILGVLLRDIVASIAFLVTIFSHRPRAIPARAGGKAVTVAQVLTILAFLADSPRLRELAWATAAIALYAIWDYYHVAPRAGRQVGGGGGGGAIE